MAYLYEDSCTTQTGTVLYKRKKHTFRVRDLRRIADKVGFPVEIPELFWWIRMVIDLLVLVMKIDHSEIRKFSQELRAALIVYMQSDPMFIDLFGGGEYGGSGTTGTWWKPFDV